MRSNKMHRYIGESSKFLTKGKCYRFLYDDEGVKCMDNEGDYRWVGDEFIDGNFEQVSDEIPIKNIGHVVYTGRPQEHIGLLPGCQYRIIEIVEDLGYTVLTDDNRKITLLPENCGTVHLNKYDHVNPDHYKTNDKEVWEYMIEIYGLDKFIAFCELNVFKYSMRVGRKPGATVEDDLGKIKWYAEKIKELRD